MLLKRKQTKCSESFKFILFRVMLSFCLAVISVSHSFVLSPVCFSVQVLRVAFGRGSSWFDVTESTDPPISQNQVSSPEASSTLFSLLAAAHHLKKSFEERSVLVVSYRKSALQTFCRAFRSGQPILL